MAVPSIEAVDAASPEADALLTEYFDFRAQGFTTHPGGYRVTRTDPAVFTPPEGVFLVVRDEGGRAVGCGAIRRIAPVSGEPTWEVKHVWLQEPQRGRGWSGLLLDELERRAVGFGARLLVLDTNASLTAAQHLYRAHGFQPVPAYNDNPNATDWFAKRIGLPGDAPSPEA